MNCIRPFKLKKNLDPSEYPDGLLVPCGKCIQCRIQKRQEWAMRVLHEKDSWDDAIFITLTYDSDLHMPGYGYTLVKKDLQLFFKRLRKNLGKRKIKYFACGEYGDKKGRPHYHAIILGMSLDPLDKMLIKMSWDLCDWSVEAIAEKAFGLAEKDSIRYVTQYIDKKYNGQKKFDMDRVCKEPNFRLLSLGIGKEFVFKNAKQLRENGFINCNGYKRQLPRYYVDKLELDNVKAREFAQLKAYRVSEKHIGLSHTADEIKNDRALSEALSEKVHKSRRQHEKNLLAKGSLKTRKL